MWWIFALISAFFASLTAIFVKIGTTGVNSNLATAIRTIVVLIIAWGIVLFKNDTKNIGSLTRQNIVFLVLSGIATGISWLCYFKAVQLGPLTKVSTIDRLSIVLTFLLSMIILNEAVTMKMFIGLLLIIAGSILVIR